MIGGKPHKPKPKPKPKNDPKPKDDPKPKEDPKPEETSTSVSLPDPIDEGKKIWDQIHSFEKDLLNAKQDLENAEKGLESAQKDLDKISKDPTKYIADQQAIIDNAPNKIKKLTTAQKQIEDATKLTDWNQALAKIKNLENDALAKVAQYLLDNKSLAPSISSATFEVALGKAVGDTVSLTVTMSLLNSSKDFTIDIDISKPESGAEELFKQVSTWAGSLV